MNHKSMILIGLNFVLVLVWGWIEFSFSNYISKLDLLTKQSQTKLAQLAELTESELIQYKNTVNLAVLRQLAKTYGFEKREDDYR